VILIFSYLGDLSTDYVIDWLNYYSRPFLRLNSVDLYNDSLKIDLRSREFLLHDRQLPIDEIKAVWFRKFGLKRDFELFRSKNINFSIGTQLHEEHVALFDTMCYLLKDKKWLTDYRNYSLNKCAVLLDAIDLGLDVSPTYIVNTKNDVLDLIGRDDYITKSIYDASFIKKRGGVFSMYTKKITSKMVASDNFPQVFSASLLQKQIEKEFEIRVFYINKKIYSMAIFSQNDPQTQVDFRNYNRLKPNRNVPYNLPNDIKIRICRLMKKLGVNCGSLDFIKSLDGKYYFLEINPVGQFGMVDFPCNYGLHQKVALELIKMDK